MTEAAMRPTRTTPTDARRRPQPAPAVLGILWLGLLAASGLTVGIGVRLRAVLAGCLTGAGVDRLIETGILAVGLGLAVWLTLSVAVATTCATGRAAGVTWRSGERLVARYAPGVVRRALVLAVGAGIGLSAATGATAAAPGDVDLGWAVTASTTTTAPVVADPTETATATAATVATTVSSSSRGSATPAEPTARPDTVVVAPGDTLWHIAQRALPSDAGAADIASAWPAWYAQNAELIGDDPDLIQPGQVLHAPMTTSTDGAS
jgi:LysM repeat protein